MFVGAGMIVAVGVGVVVAQAARKTIKHPQAVSSRVCFNVITLPHAPRITHHVLRITFYCRPLQFGANLRRDGPVRLLHAQQHRADDGQGLQAHQPRTGR